VMHDTVHSRGKHWKIFPNTTKMRDRFHARFRVRD